MIKTLLPLCATIFLVGCSIFGSDSESSKKETCALVASQQITFQEAAKRLGLKYDVKDNSSVNAVELSATLKILPFCEFYKN